MADFPTQGDDSIDDTPFDDVIDALAGDDIIFGEDGDDTFFGNLGNDVLFGGAGSDRLEGGDGNDLLSAAEAFPPGRRRRTRHPDRWRQQRPLLRVRGNDKVIEAPLGGRTPSNSRASATRHLPMSRTCSSSAKPGRASATSSAMS